MLALSLPLPEEVSDALDEPETEEEGEAVEDAEPETLELGLPLEDHVGAPLRDTEADELNVPEPLAEFELCGDSEADCEADADIEGVLATHEAEPGGALK
jgi:hypothetical protein